MKKPDEIKKGLECGVTKRCARTLCPYWIDEDDLGECISRVQADAIAYIWQLERERDAAVEDMKMLAHSDSMCDTCAHYAFDEEDESRACTDCDVETYNNWQWRRVEVG